MVSCYIAKIVQIESIKRKLACGAKPRCSLFYAKIVQGESRTKQTCLFFMPSRRLSYSKVIQTFEIFTKKVNIFLSKVVPKVVPKVVACSRKIFKWAACRLSMWARVRHLRSRI